VTEPGFEQALDQKKNASAYSNLEKASHMKGNFVGSIAQRISDQCLTIL
jgi:hypothetical protein